MARGAGGEAVAAKLHLPEECFAKGDGRCLVAHKIV
jgi:hypothetical protein